MTYESYCQILLPFFLMCCLIRLYFQASVYKICREMFDDGVGLPFQSQPDLIGDKLVGVSMEQSYNTVTIKVSADLIKSSGASMALPARITQP